MTRPISERSNDYIRNFIAAYGREGGTDGGIYTLKELLVEQLRRSPRVRSPRDVLQFIVGTASASPSGTLTYKQLWQFLFPDTNWKGNHSVSVVSDTLNTVIAYCVQHGLPLATTLVVQASSGKLSDSAITKTYEEARQYGYDVGPVAAIFVAQQAERSRELTAEMLPPS